MAMRSFPPPPADPRSSFAQPCVVRIVEVRDGTALLGVAGRSEPTPARVASTLSAKQIAHAAARGESAIVIFEEGDPSLPIVVGLLAGAEGPVSAEVETEGKLGEGPGEALQADVDGKRVVLEGKDEIVLQCGAASITLRRNGRVVIRGAYVETYATGTNRVKGGQVLIN